MVLRNLRDGLAQPVFKGRDDVERLVDDVVALRLVEASAADLVSLEIQIDETGARWLGVARAVPSRPMRMCESDGPL
jgi:hypothetical protein